MQRFFSGNTQPFKPMNYGRVQIIPDCSGLACLAISCTKNSVISDKYSSEVGGITGGAYGGGQGGDSTLDAGKITAGEWNDLENWGFWEGLLAKPDFEKYPAYWGFDNSARISVLVKNEQGYVLIDEPVQLLGAGAIVLDETRTDNRGKAELFPNLSGLYNGQNWGSLVLKINQQSFSSLKKYSDGTNELVINKQGVTPTVADIAFIVDATSSMADEISYLKTELDDVIKRVQSKYAALTVNTAAVFYRDEGDAYLTKSQPFSNNFQPVLNFIRDQQADGGGDFPEALHSALKASINNLNWSPNARARILFLVLDAPPHYEPGILDELHNYITIAAKKGIKIIPVTASGIDKETEFLMRQFSISTNSTYMFITNHSGIGNEHIEASVGQYDVEYLNNLMVRLIGKYLQ